MPTAGRRQASPVAGATGLDKERGILNRNPVSNPVAPTTGLDLFAVILSGAKNLLVKKR